MKSDINDLCEAFLAALTNAGYAVKSIENYKQVSNRFKKFCAENGYDTYTVNIGQIFADNVFNEETGAFVGYRNVMYGRFVRLINSFYLQGTFDFSMVTKEKNLPKSIHLIEIYQDYMEHLKTQYSNIGTIGFFQNGMLHLLRYMEDGGILTLKDLAVSDVVNYICSWSQKHQRNIEDELVSFEAFTRDYVKEFIIWLKGQGASTRTINLRITSIRSFLKYCGQEDFELRGIYESVCQIQKLKEEKHPILYLRPEATAAILSAYDMNTQKHRRNRMILILLYDTGARVQELADLDIESLHLDVPNPYISIIGKGRKRRNVPIMRKTVAHLNSYLKEFHPSEQSAPLFYSMRDGKPHRLSTDSISLVVGTAAKMARETCNAVPENVHCHLFRKTKAMDLYKNGIPLPFIMQLLGHESISTTSGFYAFATLEMMSDAINKSVPIIGGTEKLWKNKNAKQALYTLD